MARKQPAFKSLFDGLPDAAGAARPKMMFHPTGKEPTMQYMTICLHMIQHRPEMYDQMLKERTLLPTLERQARELKDRHEFWMEQLSETMPGSSPSQIASEAGEIARRELEDSLPPVSPQDEEEPLTLNGAMAFITRHMRHA